MLLCILNRITLIPAPLFFFFFYNTLNMIFKQFENSCMLTAINSNICQILALGTALNIFSLLQGLL